MVRARLLAVVLGIVVALVVLLAAPLVSATTLLQPRARVAPIEQPASQRVGPNEAVLPGQRRARAPDYDRSATGSSVGAEGEAAIAAARGGATSAEGSGISLDQAAAAAERNGINMSKVELSYEGPDALGHIPGAYGYSMFSGDETPLLSAAGKMQIVLQDSGLASEPDAVATIAHEMAHLTIVGPYDEAGAEAYAQDVMSSYIP